MLNGELSSRQLQVSEILKIYSPGSVSSGVITHHGVIASVSAAIPLFAEAKPFLRMCRERASSVSAAGVAYGYAVYGPEDGISLFAEAKHGE